MLPATNATARERNPESVTFHRAVFVMNQGVTSAQEKWLRRFALVSVM
jgi:hypothetical protein